MARSGAGQGVLLLDSALAIRAAADAAADLAAVLIWALLSGEVCHMPRSLTTALAEVSPPLPPLTRPVGRGGRGSTGRDDAEARSKLPAGCWAGRATGAAATAAGRSADLSLLFSLGLVSLALAA